MPVRLACTCGKQLWIPDEHAGRHVKCPTCGTSLVAPSAAAAPSAGADRPLVAGPPGRFWKPLLLVGLMVLLLGGGALAWWLFFREGSPLREGDDLAMIPANAQGFVCIHLADLWRTPAAVKALEEIRNRDREEDPGARMERETGLRPDEVERLWLVGVDADRRIGWLVVRTRQPYDRKKVLACLRDHHEHVHQGQSYHLGMNAEGRQAAVHFAGSHVLAAGSEEGVKRCLDVAIAPPVKGPLEPVIALAASPAHTAVAGAIPRGGPLEKFKGMALLNSLAEAELFTMALDVSDKTIVNATARMAGEDEAKQLARVVNAFAGMGPFGRGLLLSTFLGRELAPLAPALNKLVEQMKITQKGKELVATVTVEDGSSVAKALLSLPGAARE
jgi:hypothetical protein